MGLSMVVRGGGGPTKLYTPLRVVKILTLLSYLGYVTNSDDRGLSTALTIDFIVCDVSSGVMTESDTDNLDGSEISETKIAVNV